jgi:ribose transport system ATP-binding protein
MRTDAAQLREKFKIRAAAGSTVMSALSGGNQQKAILARWLRRDPLLLLLDEPTQGVDVGARADIYAAIREITDAGGAALLVTSDLEELAQVADRAVVLGGGTVTAEVPRAELTAHRLNELIYSEGGNTHG